MTIRNPIEWSADGLKLTGHALQVAFRNDVVERVEPTVRRVTLADLREALVAGWRDVLAARTDVIFLCFVYPLAGLLAARFTLDANLLPLLFPFVSGFALVGPVAAAGLYQMSQQRESGRPVSWRDAFAIFETPRIAGVLKLGLVLTAIFLAWLAVAMGLYRVTIGPEMPASLPAFARDVFTTPAGFALIVSGVGIGAVFAAVVLAIGAFSFPLLVDHNVSVATAVRTSVRVAMENKAVMLVWGAIVTASLALGAAPLLLGLIVVVPVLGHATWRLYRKAVA